MNAADTTAIAPARWSRDWAEAWARGWIAAWNARDVDAVLARFADDIEFRSPKAAVITGHGTVRGKADLAAYWRDALSQITALRFTLEAVNWDGASRTLTIRYLAELGPQRLLAAEILDLDDDGLARVGTALYGAPAA